MTSEVAEARPVLKRLPDSCHICHAWLPDPMLYELHMIRHMLEKIQEDVHHYVRS